MGDAGAKMNYKPAPVPGDMMGHVKDTENVRLLEGLYDCRLVGYSAKWTDSFRVYVWDDNQWRGVYPLTADDVEYHKKG